MIPRRSVHIIKGEFQILMRSMSRSRGASLQLISNWESIFADYIKTKYAVTVGSGRIGLRLILLSLGLSKNDEVIVPAYTLKDLAGIINSLGLVTVPADVDPHTFNITPKSILERITGRSKVILATHIFGVPCEIEGILEIAKERNIFVVEDCAHAVGSEFKSRKVGSFGDVSFFSFETIKPINTYGGGMVVTNHEDLAQKIRLQLKVNSGDQRREPLKKFFAAYLERVLLPSPLAFIPLFLLASQYWHNKIYRFYRARQKSLGFNINISGFQAQLGAEKIKTLAARITSRSQKVRLFKELLDNRIVFQGSPANSVSNYYFLVVLLPADLWKARKFLLKYGIDAGIGSEIADDCTQTLGYKDCPQAKNIYLRAIQLPLHENVSEKHIYYISDKLNEFMKKV